jgi:gliding motility-associated-like protein
MLYFTPNNDGVNDVWQINCIDENDEVKIYNRYGLCLASYNGNFVGWDGLYNNHSLPADDYWYILSRRQTGEVKTGHFTLKR